MLGNHKIFNKNEAIIGKDKDKRSRQMILGLLMAHFPRSFEAKTVISTITVSHLFFLKKEER